MSAPQQPDFDARAVAVQRRPRRFPRQPGPRYTSTMSFARNLSRWRAGRITAANSYRDMLERLYPPAESIEQIVGRLSNAQLRRVAIFGMGVEQDLLARNQDLSARGTALRTNIHELEQDLQEANAEVAGISNRVRDIASVTENLETDLKEAQNLIADLRGEVSQASLQGDSIASLNQRLQASRQETAEARAEIFDTTRELESARQQTQELKGRIKSLEDEVKRKSQMVKEAYGAIVDAKKLVLEESIGESSGTKPRMGVRPWLVEAGGEHVEIDERVPEGQEGFHLQPYNMPVHSLSLASSSDTPNAPLISPSGFASSSLARRASASSRINLLDQLGLLVDSPELASRLPSFALDSPPYFPSSPSFPPSVPACHNPRPSFSTLASGEGVETNPREESTSQIQQSEDGQSEDWRPQCFSSESPVFSPIYPPLFLPWEHPASLSTTEYPSSPVSSRPEAARGLEKNIYEARSYVPHPRRSLSTQSETVPFPFLPSAILEKREESNSSSTLYNASTHVTEERVVNKEGDDEIFHQTIPAAFDSNMSKGQPSHRKRSFDRLSEDHHIVFHESPPSRKQRVRK